MAATAWGGSKSAPARIAGAQRDPRTDEQSSVGVQKRLAVGFDQIVLAHILPASHAGN